MKQLFKPWRLLACSLLLLGAMVAFTSCGDDGPSSTVVNYYINVEEEFLINGSTNHTDRYYNPISRMRAAIHNVYPTPNSDGNDEAVIAACDEEYATYIGMYNGGAEHFTCLCHLVRATMREGVVIQNETLRTFVYDINPVEEPEGGE